MTKAYKNCDTEQEGQCGYAGHDKNIPLFHEVDMIKPGVVLFVFVLDWSGQTSWADSLSKKAGLFRRGGREGRFWVVLFPVWWGWLARVLRHGGVTGPGILPNRKTEKPVEVIQKY